MTEKEKKTLGPSKYANSKKKKQKADQSKKPKKDPAISKKNHDLKVKIKNLKKEINRIEATEEKNSNSQKDLEKKLAKLMKVSKENAAKFKKTEKNSKK